MATATVYIPGVTPDTAPDTPGTVMLASQTGIKVALPWAPPAGALDGLADNWDRVDRAGRQPLVRYNSAGLPTLSLDVLLADLDGAGVDDDLDQIRSLGKGDQIITISGLSPGEEGPWRLDSLSVAIEQRTESGDGIERAQVSMKFVQAVDVSLTTMKTVPAKTGPLTGGVKKPPAVKPVATATAYIVKSGDTLWAIAGRFYGDPNLWTKIAGYTRNAIKTPSLIQPGQRLWIPPK